MIAERKTSLRPILESNNGIHLTAYLVNRGNLFELKAQLLGVLDQAHEWLNPVLKKEEQNKFLEPLESLFKDPAVINQMKDNIGIFRNQKSFRVLNIPVEVTQTCQVATSFHVKPLLRWLQADQEFLLLGLSEGFAHLYLGNQASLKLVNSIIFPGPINFEEEFNGHSSFNKSWERYVMEAEAFSWMNAWISRSTKTFKPKLFVAGENHLIERMNRHLKYRNVVKTPVADGFDEKKVIDICHSIREILKEDSGALLQKTLMEFRFAEEENRARKNIFQIAKAVVRGRVRKLVVADELNIFGKIDLKSGGLSIHPFDLDHEDDDLLDDLAQLVLRQGGEVIVASREEIPKGSPILAILDDEGVALEKSKLTAKSFYNEWPYNYG